MSREWPGWPYKKEFACHRCGNCCRGDGLVEMTASDVGRAARHLGMSEQDFIRDYGRVAAGGIVMLRDQDDDLQSCIFLTEDAEGLFGCKIHPAKPEQCAGFPFQWRPKNVMSYCEGMRALEGLPPGAKDKHMAKPRKD